MHRQRRPRKAPLTRRRRGIRVRSWCCRATLRAAAAGCIRSASGGHMPGGRRGSGSPPLAASYFLALPLPVAPPAPAGLASTRARPPGRPPPDAPVRTAAEAAAPVPPQVAAERSRQLQTRRPGRGQGGGGRGGERSGGLPSQDGSALIGGSESAALARTCPPIPPFTPPVPGLRRVFRRKTAGSLKLDVVIARPPSSPARACIRSSGLARGRARMVTDLELECTICTGDVVCCSEIRYLRAGCIGHNRQIPRPANNPFRVGRIVVKQTGRIRRLLGLGQDPQV